MKSDFKNMFQEMNSYKESQADDEAFIRKHLGERTNGLVYLEACLRLLRRKLCLHATGGESWKDYCEQNLPIGRVQACRMVKVAQVLGLLVAESKEVEFALTAITPNTVLSLSKYPPDRVRKVLLEVPKSALFPYRITRHNKRHLQCQSVTSVPM